MELDSEKAGENWPPLPDVICFGIPNRDTHEPRRADAHDVAISSSIGVASGHRIERSVTVNK